MIIIIIIIMIIIIIIMIIIIIIIIIMTIIIIIIIIIIIAHVRRCSERVDSTSHPFIILLCDICFKRPIPNNVGCLNVFRTTP